MKSSRSEYVDIRGLKYHIRHWGTEGAPKLFMLHGWMDVAASFQFVVDALQKDWHVIAPDWRGFGLTEGNGSDTYWFPDYLGDLDDILDHYSAGSPTTLVGHSMGGNIACIYAGARPARVARIVNLEGFGLPSTRPDQAPERYAKWLDEIRHKPKMRPYDSQEEVAERLRKTNPRLSAERASFLSAHWAAPNASGEWIILGDPAHKMTNPVLYRIEEVLACWKAIKADVLWVEADDTDALRWMGPKESAREEIDRRLKAFAKVKTVTVMDASHMLHHDQPEKIAALIEDFLSA
jgi:pimeloyl-ACP methyl ester carboxylesterase